MAFRTTRKHRSVKHKTRKHNSYWKGKYIILTEDTEMYHIRRPIYTEYINKNEKFYTVGIPYEYLNTINKHIGFYNNKGTFQIFDKLTQKKYKLFGKVNKDMLVLQVPYEITAISSKWPEKLPSNLPFEVKVISPFDLGEPSVWRVARYVENPKTKTQYFLKLMPKDILRGIDKGDKLDRIYKEIDNQHRSKSPYVIGIQYGEYENFVWALVDVTPNGSLFELKESFPDKKMPEYIALYIFKQIVYGLSAIHKAHVLHNWLQLRTIMIDSNYNIKIGNFGESINLLDYTEFEKKYLEQNLISWPEFKAKMVSPPEWAHKVAYTKKTDIWSIGIILYKLLINKEEDKQTISPLTKNLLENILNKDPNSRFTLKQILLHPTMSSIKINNKLNLVTRDIKLWTFSNYFLNQFKDTFYFKKSVSETYKEKYIKEYLLGFTKNFCYDKHTGWNSIINKIWYHDQATVVYDMDWPNQIIITKFNTNEYFKLDTNDLFGDSLPEKYLKYISNNNWNNYKAEFDNALHTYNNHFNNKEMKHFTYSDLEKNREKTFETLPTQHLLSNGKKFQLQTDKQVLSLLVKISKQQCKVLNEQGRLTSQGEKFDELCFYIPIELCTNDVISNLMASAYAECKILKKRFEESYCYITIRKSNIHPSTKQGVSGWHVDGSWGEQTFRHQNIECQNGIYTGLFSDRNYIIQSTEEIKTPVAIVPLNLDSVRKEAMKKYNEGEITVLPSDLQNDVILHKYLTHNVDYPPYQPPGLTKILDIAVEQAVKDNPSAIIELPANSLNFFTAYTIHNVPKNNTNTIIPRNTFRIAYSSDYFDKACGPTINPSIGIPGALRFFPYPVPYELRKNVNLISHLF